ncbi:pantetheine-phosphate adenylyltransferase [Acetobacterium fimetarium]|uniref:Phosphopantetheine adenylyltransferase n=1 Tax=Acetobacterium fimetarium TaxID=52691 RepID=A0ABR6WVT4_9FIRM|nr:pantetheine-phosphate adenylyltransferase [Acetobacterium fimetarium]MBC3804742.1 pantetheine-phosphate adenylyltransferase [Acetobacterium fimetarium]
MSEKIAVYPGSFDPITKGHLDMIERAAKIFDKVIVCVMVNSSKEYLFTRDEREQLINDCIAEMKNVEVDSYDGLLIDYVKLRNTNIIVKGLRAFLDFEYEFQMALTNKHLDNDIETMFMISSNKHSYLSSTLVKELVKFQGDVTEFLPKNVERAMQKKYEEGYIR